MTTKKKTAKQALEPMCYCGPEINHVRNLATFEVIPAGLREAMTVCPLIKRLIVPVTDMAETRKKTMTAGTTEYACYQAVLKFKGGK